MWYSWCNMPEFWSVTQLWQCVASCPSSSPSRHVACSCTQKPWPSAARHQRPILQWLRPLEPQHSHQQRSRGSPKISFLARSPFLGMPTSRRRYGTSSIWLQRTSTSRGCLERRIWMRCAIIFLRYMLWPLMIFRTPLASQKHSSLYA